MISMMTGVKQLALICLYSISALENYHGSNGSLPAYFLLIEHNAHITTCKWLERRGGWRMMICELTVRVDPDTVSCANICRGPSSVYRGVFSVPFSKWMIVMWGSFIFDLHVFIHALSHASDAHPRVERERRPSSCLLTSLVVVVVFSLFLWRLTFWPVLSGEKQKKPALIFYFGN